MRCLGQIEHRRSAEEFVAFLLVQGITTQVEPVAESQDSWEIWVRDEDRMADAAAFLAEYRSQPSDPKYASAVKQATQTLQEKARQRVEAARNLRQVKYRSAVASDRRIPPFTLTLIILCVVVSFMNNFGRPGQSNEIGKSISRQMSFVTKSDFEKSNQDPLANIRRGEFWRAITPIFLHLSALHLVMNVIGMVVLGRVCERWLGTWKFALLVLAAAVLPNLLQALAPAALHGNPFFGGISGVVYALFGLVWIRSMINPLLGIMIPFPYVVMLLLPIAIGFSGVVPGWNQADLCHLGGLLVGVASAYMIERS